MIQPNEHQGRVAVITGGSGAIGGAIARRLHDESAAVHVLDLKPSQASEWSFHTVNVANESAVDTTFDAIGNLAGRIADGSTRCRTRRCRLHRSRSPASPRIELSIRE